MAVASNLFHFPARAMLPRLVAITGGGLVQSSPSESANLPAYIVSYAPHQRTNRYCLVFPFRSRLNHLCRQTELVLERSERLLSFAKRAVHHVPDLMETRWKIQRGSAPETFTENGA